MFRKRTLKRVKVLFLLRVAYAWCVLQESRSLGLEHKVGDKFHLRQNICEIPIAYKYHEGIMKRTLKRESKEIEIAEGEAASYDCFRGRRD